MTTFDPQAPGSPPELTGSKSSTSSSIHSSSLSGADGSILSDISHFEDIGLDDDHHGSYAYEQHSLPKYPLLPAVARPIAGGRSSPPDTTTVRELTNGTKRPTYPSLHGQAKEAVSHSARQSLNLPKRRDVRRGGLTSPSVPTLAMTAMWNRSRSPSPTHTSASPRPIANPHHRQGPASVTRPASRRGSWQPSRKTTKELEDEYHDSDEDLPDDASLWNVPMSPRPPQERAKAGTPSANASPSTSPERGGLLSSALSNGMTTIRPQRSAPNTGYYRRGTSGSAPSSPLRPSLPHAASTGAIPDFAPKARVKSWTLALSELSEEAKALTKALELHAEQTERVHEEKIQNGVSSARPSLDRTGRSKTTVVELPPLRKSEVMIDPLPVSKEKEKVLSRTRPSWLPPKSRKEEKKHLKEYQRMMELSLETERKKAAKAAEVQCTRDDTKSALLRIWEEHVLPNWEQAIREPRTRELWWRGIAPRSRAEVWQRAIGNELSLTESTYTKALERAREVEKDIASRKADSEPRKEREWFTAIRQDVKSAFPDLKIFQPIGGPLHDTLLDVLMAYSMYRSDVGYSHGTHLIAALLLLTLPTPACTFQVLANLLNRPLPLAFLTSDPGAIKKAYQLILSILKVKCPRLHTHLFNSSHPPDGKEAGLQLTPEQVFEPMMRTLFLKGLGLENAVRVWDIMVFDGDSMVIRTAVGVLTALEGKLYGSKEEALGVLGWRLEETEWDVGNEDDFIKYVRAAGKA
ncbi:Rab-GTPase-TBC domain [Lasallia pustulata]|uniref:Rab-GTPase-TBC domain n=1 Tax=Lasallia pustulata TaxID=136370 RepID=A0A1W5CSV8_9LECA|nr:Rab-GTPase-TBC domain [Lasallia pustulata]